MSSKIKIVLNRQTINAIDLAPLEKYVAGHDNARYFNLEPGQEHYKFLAYLSTLLPPNSTVLDIGTYLGFSATALAYNPQTRVITYDIVDCIPNKDARTDQTNITYRIGDCTKDATDLVKDAHVIMLDVDPHDGIQEPQILKAFVDAGFKGIIVFDDINVNEAMNRFWTSLNIPGTTKYDASVCGHHSGTGLLVWDDSDFEVEVETI